jgi:hypothetical protein
VGGDGTGWVGGGPGGVEPVRAASMARPRGSLSVEGIVHPGSHIRSLMPGFVGGGRGVLTEVGFGVWASLVVDEGC